MNKLWERGSGGFPISRLILFFFFSFFGLNAGMEGRDPHEKRSGRRVLEVFLF